MKLKINLMLENLIELELKGDLISKEKIIDKEIPKWDSYAERSYIVGIQHCTEFKETWNIIKPNGEVFKLDFVRRTLEYKGKKEEFLFEDFFRDKIVYEDFGINDLEEFGEVKEVN